MVISRSFAGATIFKPGGSGGIYGWSFNKQTNELCELFNKLGVMNIEDRRCIG
jgi:hypothetical protein